MFPTILSVLLTALLGADDPATKDVKSLIDTIETLQKPVQDFRCEYEGTVHYKGKTAEGFQGKLDGNGLYEAFSGTFIWKRGGDTSCDILKRRGADNTIERETLLVRRQQRQAEVYLRLNNAPIGLTDIKKADDFRITQPNCLGTIFLIDELKRIAAHTTASETEITVSDDEIEGRPLKLLTGTFKNVPDSLLSRQWIDLRRNGHVVRVEHYMRDKAGKSVESSRLEIKLAPFKVGDTEVWMPVSGTRIGHWATVNPGNLPILINEPGSFETIKVVDGTMKFNQRPGLEVFTTRYKPGPPISDQLHELTAEFNRQPIEPKPTKANAEKRLKDQLGRSESRRKALVAVPLSERFNWSSALIWVMGALVLCSTGALWIQRRRN